MLPALANYFGISVDELLGMSEIAKKLDTMKSIAYGMITIKRNCIMRMSHLCANH